MSAMAEREGFEPPIRLPVCRISSAVLSTTQPPLQLTDIVCLFTFPKMAPSVVATEFATEGFHFWPSMRVLAT
jgi:hypothetical protein